MNRDTQKLLEIVAEKTGHKVAVSQSADIGTHSRMIAASAGSPMHLIEVNEKYHKYGDYLVASQCAMLLVKWANPERIPVLVVNQGKVEYLVNKVAGSRAIGKVTPEVARKYAEMVVGGLLNQLQSVPVEMMAIAYIRNTCTALVELQDETMALSLREGSAILAPNVRADAPVEIFDKSAAMNAAFALNWSRLTGSDVVLLPFRSLGYLDKGQDLFRIFESVPDNDPDRYVKVVDGWAQMLHLSTLYAWRFRKASEE
jgi:hypothetical protein